MLTVLFSTETEENELKQIRNLVKLKLLQRISWRVGKSLFQLVLFFQLVLVQKTFKEFRITEVRIVLRAVTGNSLPHSKFSFFCFSFINKFSYLVIQKYRVNPVDKNHSVSFILKEYMQGYHDICNASNASSHLNFLAPELYFMWFT